MLRIIKEENIKKRMFLSGWTNKKITRIIMMIFRKEIQLHVVTAAKVYLENALPIVSNVYEQE